MYIIDIKIGDYMNDKKFRCVTFSLKNKLYIIIFTFCIGCGIGAIFSNLIGAKSVWVCAIIMFTVSFILVYEEKKNYNAVAAANS